MDSHILTHSLGYPRIGEKRELKKAIEAFWQGAIPVEELQRAGKQLRKTHWLVQREAGLDLIPSNDFSYYDQMLDMTCLLGNVPRRFGWNGDPIGLDLVFQIARGTGSACNHEGRSCEAGASSIHASEMTKWFDTNYHYIVPEFRAGTTFKLSATKPFDEFQEALALGIRTKPVLIGPLTYLHLGKSVDAGFDRLALLDFRYPNEVGPGVWDIHSPRVPEIAEMVNMLRKAAAVLPIENLWVNPDCGLKTRAWKEVIPSVRNMVKAAAVLREARARASGVDVPAPTRVTEA